MLFKDEGSRQAHRRQTRSSNTVVYSSAFFFFFLPPPMFRSPVLSLERCTMNRVQHSSLSHSKPARYGWSSSSSACILCTRHAVSQAPSTKRLLAPDQKIEN